jgi:MFS family permease
MWAVASILLGLGFTFFSGAVEAWLVDAMIYAKYKGSLESVFGRGQMVGGIAMLGGSVAGGIIAQATNLGVPFVIRGVVLLLLFLYAFVVMRDLGFTPDRTTKTFVAMKHIFNASLEHGLKNPSVRFVMLAAPFTASVGFFGFYALQPYLLEVYGDTTAYSIAGLAAAIVAGAQIAGGLLAGKIRSLFKRRTTALITGTAISAGILLVLGVSSSFWLALILMSMWGLLFAATMPIRQAYLNTLIPSKQRATVLSFDSLVGNAGSIGVQPGLGKVADVYSYGTALIVGSVIQLCAIPVLIRARLHAQQSDFAATASSSQT